MAKPRLDEQLEEYETIKKGLNYYSPMI